ncbi:MAG: GDSL-type esterase/lipase family protein [Bacteroidales bacterium]
MKKYLKRYCTNPAIASFVALAAITIMPKSTETMVLNPGIKSLARLNYRNNKIIINREGLNLPIKPNTNEPIRIVHLGDSHVQAGFFTDEIRNLLSSYMNNSAISVGYAFPYNLAKTNSPFDYTFQSTGKWKFLKILGSAKPIQAGLSGMAMETTDYKASFMVSTNSPKNGIKSFDQITVFCPVDSISYTPAVEGSETEIISQSQHHITFKLKTPVCEARIGLKSTGKRQKQFTLLGLELVNSTSKVIYNSAGLNGADVKAYLLAAELAHQLKVLNPQLVIVSLGTNDACHPSFDVQNFGIALNTLLNRINTAVPNATILLTTPSDHLLRLAKNPHLTEAKTAIITSAFRNNCCVWDFHTIMGGEGSIRTWSSMGLTAPDLLHLNIKGYQLQGELLFEAITCNEFLTYHQ